MAMRVNLNMLKGAYDYLRGAESMDTELLFGSGRAHAGDSLEGRWRACVWEASGLFTLEFTFLLLITCSLGRPV